MNSKWAATTSLGLPNLANKTEFPLAYSGVREVHLPEFSLSVREIPSNRKTYL